MKTNQYTLRSIPDKVDKALRQTSKRTGRSLNDVAVEALAKGIGVTSGATFDDLDWFIGGRSIDTSFDKAVVWLDGVPKKIQ